MIAILYRWRVKDSQEQAFQDAWAEMTVELGKSGSLGSALFKGDDGTTYALARWPDDATRNAAFSADPLPDVQQHMRDAVVETFQPVRLSELDNLWKPFP